MSLQDGDTGKWLSFHWDCFFPSCLQQHTEIMCQAISEQKSRSWHGVNLLRLSFLLRECSCHSGPSAAFAGASPRAASFTAILTLLARSSDLCKSDSYWPRRVEMKRMENSVMQIQFAGRIQHLPNAIRHNSAILSCSDFVVFNCDNYSPTLKR